MENNHMAQNRRQFMTIGVGAAAGALAMKSEHHEGRASLDGLSQAERDWQDASADQRNVLIAKIKRGLNADPDIVLEWDCLERDISDEFVMQGARIDHEERQMTIVEMRELLSPILEMRMMRDLKCDETLAIVITGERDDLILELWVTGEWIKRNDFASPELAFGVHIYPELLFIPAEV
jgi:hypothetical protein